MLTTTRRTISYPNTTRVDAPDIPLHFQNLATALDIDVIWTSGLLSARPASAVVGTLYYSTDIPQVDLWIGSWVTIYPQTGTSVPIGGVIEFPYAAGSIPSWALLPYGQAINRTTYSALNALDSAASRPWGAGDGSTTFNLPDARGRVMAGKDDMGGVAANRITAAISGTAGTVLGAAVGSEGVTLTTGQIPSHNHSVTGSPGISDPNHSHGVTDPGHRHIISVYSGGGSSHLVEHLNERDPATRYDLPADGTTIQLASTGVSVNGAATGITVNAGSLGTGNSGGGGVHINMPPTIVVNKIIRVQ